MISSHSPIATEAAIGVRLLLFRPAAICLPEQISCNPWLSGPAFYGRTILLSFLPTSRDSGTKCHSGIRVSGPGGFLQLSVQFWAEARLFPDSL